METRHLPVELTEAELNQRRDILAGLVRDHTHTEVEKKEAATRHANKLKEIQKSMAITAKEIRNKAEDREVPVTRVKNFTLGVEEIRRVDTGEIVDSRALGPDEKQVPMFNASRDDPEMLNAPPGDPDVDPDTGEVKQADTDA
jgi:hypothetical protein